MEQILKVVDAQKIKNRVWVFRKKIWKEYVKKITNEENNWDQVTNVDLIETENNFLSINCKCYQLDLLKYILK